RPAMPSMRAEVWRNARYMKSRITICTTMATAATITNASMVLSLATLKSGTPRELSLLAFAAGFAIGLARRLQGRSELFFLPADHVFTALHPLVHVLSGFATAIAKVFLAFQGAVLQGFASFPSRAGSVQHAQ